MNLSVLLSSGGEPLFVGLMIGLLTLLVTFIYNSLKPKVQDVATNIKVNINPNDVNSLIKKGYSEVSRKNYTSAIDYFRKALSLSPTNWDAYAGIAFAYHSIKDYPNSKTAIEAYQENVNIDTLDNSMAALMTYLYGHHYFMEGNFEQAKICKDNAKGMAIVSNVTMDIINDLNLY